MAAENEYYTSFIINNSIATTQQSDDPSATSADTRSQPFIKNASNWKCQVECVSSHHGKSLPIWTPTISPTSATDITTTSLTFTMGIYANSGYYSATQNVIWVPENQAAFTSVPTTAQPSQKGGDYYYCYSYSHFVDMVNTALNTAWGNVVSAAGGSGQCGTQCPFFEFNSETGLFSLYQDANTSVVPYGTALPAPYSATSTATSPVGTYAAGEYSFLGYNENAWLLLTNFDTKYYAYQGALWGSSATYLPENVINFGLTNLNNTSGVGSTGLGLQAYPSSVFQLQNPFTNTPITNAVYIRASQNFISTGTIWSPIMSIVVATTQIPVEPENVSNTITIGTANTGQGLGGITQKVILEVPVNAITTDFWTGLFHYQPLVPTWFDLVSNDVLRNLDISVYARHRLTGKLSPLQLPNGASILLRLHFQLK